MDLLGVRIAEDSANALHTIGLPDAMLHERASRPAAGYFKIL